MDPVSQGVFGAVFAQTRSQKKNLAKAAVIGALAGMAPDLDIVLRSTDDPLFALEFHRHFTHSLIFIPIGALICSIVFYFLLAKRWGLSFAQTYVWSLLGFATHGLLDACTSYGTQLLWPFTDFRVAWDLISIVDPLVTIPLIALVVLASRRKAKRYAFLAVLWVGLYFGFSYTQQQKALAVGYAQAAERGLEVIRLEAKPSFGNIRIWKLIYETEDKYHVDAVKVGFKEPVLWKGDSINKLDIDRDLPWLDKNSQQAKDIERFRWFSSGYIALDKDSPYRVMDVRYSLLPQEIKPLWGIVLSNSAEPDDHITYYSERGDSVAAIKRIWEMLSK